MTTRFSLSLILSVLALFWGPTGYAQTQAGSLETHVDLIPEKDPTGTGTPAQNDALQMSYLPMTIRVTDFFKGQDFEKLTLEEIRVSGIMAEFMNLGQAPTKKNRFVLGVRGELFSFDDQQYYTPSKTGSYARLDVTSVDAVGIYRFQDEVYLQLKLSIAVGERIGHASLLDLTDQQKEDFYRVIDCVNCRTGMDWHSQTGDVDDTVVLGANAKIVVKRFQLSLYTKTLFGGALYSYSEGQGNQSSYAYLQTNIAHTEETLRFDYRIGEVKNFGDLSLFIAYSHFDFHETYNATSENSGVVSIYKSATLSPIRNEMSMFRAGIKVNLFKKTPLRPLEW